MMKITAGLGRIDDYEDYVRAGADELFAGYVPAEWLLSAGAWEPLNRREVNFVNVQLGTQSELEILADMVRACGVPVTLTINSPFYSPERYPMILEIMERCRNLGFSSFIIADPVLLCRIRGAGLTGLDLHLSGEAGAVNRYAVSFAREHGVSRIIFPRKTDIDEMASVIRAEREREPDHPMSFEAFAMNEMCHYDGAWCMSLHCDAFSPACRLPCRLVPAGNANRKNAKPVCWIAQKGQKPLDAQRGQDGQKGRDMQKGQRMQPPRCDAEDQTGNMTQSNAAPGIEAVPGASGCGLCALYSLREAGVTHLKVVSRGEESAEAVEDIRALRTALDILENSADRESYISEMKRTVFPRGCGRKCYYPDLSGN
ncbi:MAG: U32 family peptidase [Lachnospiraceae bacterium]|jgi:collagenase-like PrtC family protease